jgi:hypothetical protein
MKQSNKRKLFFPVFFLFCCLVFVSYAGAASAVIQKHRTNFFLFEKNNSVFYPVGANAKELMNASFPQEAVAPLLKTWAEAGINTLRICLDDYADWDQWKKYEKSDGTLSDEAMQRLQLLLKAVKDNGMVAIVCLFDLQSMAARWEEHPYNTQNGGPCESIGDFFTKPEMLGRATKRIKQIVPVANTFPLLAYELARGVNIWEQSTVPSAANARKGEFWVFRVSETLRRADQKQHLTALSFVPNTMPITLMAARYIDINLLSIQSNDPVVAASSSAKLIQTARDFKKPVFFSEIRWTGRTAQRTELVRNVFWASVASSSGSFLSPQSMLNDTRITNEELMLVQTLQPFLDYVDLDGYPRPPSKVAIEVDPKGSYLLVEGMQGSDWIFWIMRLGSGDNKPKLDFRTVEGQYQYHWFDTEVQESGRKKTFYLTRKEVTLQVPEFNHDIIGVLRLLQRAPKPAKSETGINK